MHRHYKGIREKLLYLFDDFRRVSAYDNIIRNVFGYHCTCCDNAILTDCHTWADDRAYAYPGVLFDCDFFEIELMVSFFEVMIDGSDSDV